MSPILVALIGCFFGGLIVWLTITGHAKWKKGRGMMGKPGKQAEENKKKMEAAKADRKKGRSEVMGSLVYLALTLALIFLLFLFFNYTVSLSF